MPEKPRSLERGVVTKKLKTIVYGTPGELLRRSSIEVADFRKRFDGLGERHFVFLDPPYLTDFSSYGGYHFTREDHLDLARRIKSFGGDYLLVVGGRETVDLYKDQLSNGFLYFWNGKFKFFVKNRNDKETEYLVASSRPLTLIENSIYPPIS